MIDFRVVRFTSEKVFDFSPSLVPNVFVNRDGHARFFIFRVEVGRRSEYGSRIAQQEQIFVNFECCLFEKLVDVQTKSAVRVENFFVMTMDHQTAGSFDLFWVPLEY